jgi:formimidoylglutamate deiminase
MQWERPTTLYARKALTDAGWQDDVTIALMADGRIASITPNTVMPAGAPSFDLVLPGMNNVHSHVFQRAMVGLTEIASGEGKDNFWSWREVMYAFTRTLTPESIEATAHALYIDMLKNGYTGVGEFHYMHHDANGAAYRDPAELSHRIIAASEATGIHLTHLPVIYETANFGGVPAHAGQQRFVHTVDRYLALMESLVATYKNSAVRFGVAPHSLRAVTPESLATIVNALPSFGLADGPIHMHIAEQVKEVEDCLAWSGKRPMQWLMENHAVDARWCLVHSTHLVAEEVALLARSRAVAGLCPTTEANLGDGIFPAQDYLAQNGRFGVGTDSQVCVSPWQELRQLEYAQRLITRSRNVLHTAETPSVGRTLFTRAAAGGAQALGINGGALAVGKRADLLGISLAHPLLAERQDDAILDTLIFALEPKITDVFVAGNHVIKDGQHPLEKR